MILVDSNMVSNYDSVRCSETSHHINFIVVYRFQGKGKILSIFNRKTLLAVFLQIIPFHDKDLNDKTRASLLSVSLAHIVKAIHVCQMHEETAE